MRNHALNPMRRPAPEEQLPAAEIDRCVDRSDVASRPLEEKRDAGHGGWRAGSGAGGAGPLLNLNQPKILSPRSCCAVGFLVVSPGHGPTIGPNPHASMLVYLECVAELSVLSRSQSLFPYMYARVSLSRHAVLIVTLFSFPL